MEGGLTGTCIELHRCQRIEEAARVHQSGAGCSRVHAELYSASLGASVSLKHDDRAVGCGRRTAKALGPQDGSRELRFACDEWLLASRRVVELLTHESQAAAAMKTCLLADARLDFQLHLTGSRIRPPFDRPDTIGSIVPVRVS